MPASWRRTCAGSASTGTSDGPMKTQPAVRACARSATRPRMRGSRLSVSSTPAGARGLSGSRPARRTPARSAHSAASAGTTQKKISSKCAAARPQRSSYRTQRSSSSTGTTANTARTSRGRAETSSSAAPTGYMPISLPSRWTTWRWASRASCAPATCSVPRRGRSGSSRPWAALRRSTATARCSSRPRGASSRSARAT